MAGIGGRRNAAGHCGRARAERFPDKAPRNSGGTSAPGTALLRFDLRLESRMIRQFAAAFLALAIAAPAAAVPGAAPKVGIDSFAQLQTPLPYPYDEAANADAQVAGAKARARAAGKLLLIDLGGNWCADCRILTATMDRPELRAFVDRHFETVLVDVGHMD